MFQIQVEDSQKGRAAPLLSRKTKNVVFPDCDLPAKTAWQQHVPYELYINRPTGPKTTILSHYWSWICVWSCCRSFIKCCSFGWLWWFSSFLYHMYWILPGDEPTCDPIWITFQPKLFCLLWAFNHSWHSSSCRLMEARQIYSITGSVSLEEVEAESCERSLNQQWLKTNRPSLFLHLFSASE